MKPYDPEKDNEKALDDEVTPIVRQLVEVCEKHGIPVVVGAQYSRFGLYRAMSIPSGSHPSMYEIADVLNPDEENESDPPEGLN